MKTIRHPAVAGMFYPADSRSLRAEVDDMAMLRLIARDSGWLTVLPEVVVQDELRSGALVTVGRSSALQERFYAITTRQRHRIDALEALLARAPAVA